MPSGNGAKAQQKRERNNAKKQSVKGSQIDSRAAAFKAQCNICKCQVVNEKALAEHMSQKLVFLV